MFFGVVSAQNIKEQKLLDSLKIYESENFDRRYVESMRGYYYFEKGTDILANGKIITRDEEKNNETMLAYVGGQLKYTVERDYYDNGKLRSCSFLRGSSYMDESSSGISISYFYDGTIERDYKWSKKDNTEEEKEYSEEGILVFERNGEKRTMNGCNKYYYGDGQIKEEYCFKNFIEVFRREYFIDGSLKVEFDDSTYLKKTYYHGGQLATCDTVDEKGNVPMRTDYYEGGIIMQKLSFSEKPNLANWQGYELDGNQFRYHSNGQLESCIYWEKGELADTLIMAYHPNGNIHAHIPFKNGKPYGVGYTYYDDGRTHTEIYYDSVGKVNTLNVFIYDGFNPYYDAELLLFYFYFSDSEGYESIKYVYGEGPYIVDPLYEFEDDHDHYVPDDSNEVIYYAGHDCNGVLKEFYANGNLKKEVVFGEKSKKTDTYYENGQLKAGNEYNNYKWDGLHFCYYPNGQAKYEVDYKDGYITNDTVRIYYEDGSLYMITSYNDGYKDGMEVRYDRSGNKVSSIKYEKYVEKVAVNNFSEYKNSVAKSTVYYSDDRIRAEILYLKSPLDYIAGSVIGKVTVYYYEDMDLIKEDVLRVETYISSEYIEFINDECENNDFEVSEPDVEYFRFNNHLKLLSNESMTDEFYDNLKMSGEVKTFYDNRSLKKEILYDFGNKKSVIEYEKEKNITLENKATFVEKDNY